MNERADDKVTLTEEQAKKAKVKIVLELDGEILHEINGDTIVGVVLERNRKESSVTSYTLIGPEIVQEEINEALMQLIEKVMGTSYDMDQVLRSMESAQAGNNVVDINKIKH